MTLFSYCEPSLQFDPAKATDFPDFDLMLFDKIVAFDHLKQKLFIIVNVRTDNLEVNYAKAEREITAVEALLSSSVAQRPFIAAKLGEVKSNQSKGSIMQLMCRNAKIYQEWRCISK